MKIFSSTQCQQQKQDAGNAGGEGRYAGGRVIYDDLKLSMKCHEKRFFSTFLFAACFFTVRRCVLCESNCLNNTTH